MNKPEFPSPPAPDFPPGRYLCELCYREKCNCRAWGIAFAIILPLAFVYAIVGIILVKAGVFR